jgi:hypothetical protein
MELDFTDLAKIKPEKLDTSNKDLMLTLALIRNDMSDLAYLQSLFIDDNKDIKPTISAKNAQFTGRSIYILRLALSQFYAFLEFLHNRKEEIVKNKKLQDVISKINNQDRQLWKDLCTQADNLFSKGDKNVKTLIFKNSVKNLLELSSKARNQFTFHYHHSYNYLNQGFNTAFKEDKKTISNEFAYVTEKEDVFKDRAYYIDLAIKRYFETSLNDKQIDVIQKDFLDVFALGNRILFKILRRYYNSIVERE